MDPPKGEVYEFFKRIDMLKYYEAFCREGFECIESIADIQESDFEVLGVKRGHRRFIQRRAIEFVNSVRFSRELPPITSPMLAIQPTQQLQDIAPLSSLEEVEPLTSYLHRPRSQHLASQQGQRRSPSEQKQQPSQQIQQQKIHQQQQHQQHTPPAHVQQQSPIYPSYMRRYSPHSRGQAQLQKHALIDQQHQQQHGISSTSSFPSRQTVPFPMAPSDTITRQPSNLHSHSPASGTPSTIQSQIILQQPPLQQQTHQKQIAQQHGLGQNLVLANPLIRSEGRGMSRATRPPYINTFTPQDLPISTPQQRQQHPGIEDSVSYPHQPISASTDTSSPRKQRASPTSPFSGPYQQPVSSIADVMRSPLMQQRPRGPSITSTSSANTITHAGASSNRRRASRADPRSPYSRPAAIPRSPHSPQSPTSPNLPRRTYRRHPKKDPNAPEKWRSAYQLFRDDVNRELHGQDIPFSEMSKIHSKRWAELSDDLRTQYFEQSKLDKEEYTRKMTGYEQTLEFKQYEEYLENFYKQDSTVNRVGRPKGTRSSTLKVKDSTKESAGSGHSRSQSMVHLDMSMRDTPTSSLSSQSSHPSREHTPTHQR